MKALFERITKILKDRKTRKIWYRVISGFAAFVIFVTTYALVMPALTLESSAATCGIEAHQHTDDCYEERLMCGQEESEGHQHDDDCYSVSKKLVCDNEEHRHDDSCYDQDGNLVCGEKEHTHSDDCYQEVRELTCDIEESKGHHHDSSCYEKVLVCGKEAHTHSEKCYEKAGENASKESTTEKADKVKTDVSENSEETLPENASETKAPTLDPVNMEAMLNKHTDMYYFHAEDGEEIPADSMEIKDWQKVKDSTELASDDLVRLYLAYTIPAGSLNETNPVARYRLPENVKLTDKQIKAINENENGITAAYSKDSADYEKYLGAEAVDGDRRPGETLKDGDQEYISAVVRAENVYKNDKYIGQDLIFTFVPYTVEKNQNTYDANGNTVKAAQKVTGWFACDLKLSQIEWTEAENDSNADDTASKTVEKTAEVVFAAEDKKEDIEEISCTLKLVEQDEKDTQEKESEKEQEQEYKSGTLTSDGDGYTVTMDYTADAKVPENARLSVREITAETDSDSYEDYLAQAEQHVAEYGENKANVDKEATRFFDIEILVDDGNGNESKIEPAAPVNVRIQMDDAPVASEGGQQSDPTVLHFAEDGVETIEATAGEAAKDDSKAKTGNTGKEDAKKSGTSAESGDATEIRFEAESFSVYGVVYTVDFEYSVNGRMYQFSLPGGGFVSFTDLVEVLDILGDAEVSEAASEFVADVVSLEFSSPELVDVSKVDADTTVGQIKKSRGLKCQYSAELTEEQITEINAQTVEAGDWALISVLPFMSDETLTVTMTDGEVFMIKVTDAQISKTVIDARGDTWEITVTYGEDAQIPEGAELKVSEILPEDVKYIEYYRKATDLVCEDEAEGNRHGYGRLFDISIWNGKEEIEPQSNVEVSIKLANAPEDSNELRVVHFGKLEPEVMLLEETPERDSLNTNETVVDKKETVLRFETDSFSVYAVVSTNTSDGTGLGGQKFAIVNPNGTRGEAVLGRSQENNTALSASEVTIQQISGQTYLVGGEVSVWEFENVNNNNYYIKAPDGQYMNLGNGTAFLSATPQVITVSRSGNGLRLANNGYGLNAWNRNVSQGFRAGTFYDDASRFTLYGVNELIQNQAEKISLTDLVDLHDGETPVDEVVIYTRILNQERDGYDYYAVTADGSLVPVFDIGDTIGWVSANDTPEHLKWKLTVHSSGGVNNGYFDFQSMENGLYLIPTEPNGLKTDDPEDSWDLGVNMQGWNNGTYGSFIERWNADIREYVGYGYDAVNKKIVPTADDSQKLEFLFAHVKEDTAPNQLHTVDTLDGKTKGITIKMYDFNGSSLNPSWPPRSSEMTTVMGQNSTGSTNVDGVGYANRGLVSQTLTDDGFPIATQTNRSLSQLFNDSHFKSDASNIFVRQVYDETGYFSYDSSKNYAYLDQGQNQFILYRELAAPEMEGDTTPSANKGNFFPFDSLQDLADQNKVFTNRFVKYDGDLHEMTPDNPQYGETLYKIANGNTNNYSSYFFGMTMEAHFYQGRDGKDEWGNDIIYEFNGDDDMWLYIDDRLVLDIGGCHGAVSGTVNFATGEVRVNGSRNQVHTTLKQIFQNAGKLPDGTNWTTEGAQKWFRDDTFADYTQHSFKMIYMERGSYASNLKMKFNLMTIEPGTFVLEKKLPDEVQSYGEQTFAYQIYTVSDDHETLYTPPEGKQVTYEKSGEPVPIDQEGNSGFKSTYKIGDIPYNNVYLLKPYEPIVIPTVSNDVRYFIREIGIDADRYEIVKANSIVLQDTKQNPAVDRDNDRTTATTDIDSVRARGRVTYENIPKETHNLRLEKLLQGPAVNPDDSFRFDVQLEDSVTGQLIPYYMGEYYIVKTDDGGVDHYYKYENGTLVQSSEPVAYKAGVSGSIDHIIPGYTILITGLLPGTDFQVTENLSAGEYPEGYLYAGKSVQNAGDPELEGSDGRISARGEGGNNDGYHDALVQITNISGTDINLMKVDKNDLGETDPDCLKGASFTLSKYTDSTFQSKDVNWGDNGSKTLKDEKNPNGTYTLNGVFEFKQLTVGYYKIEEIEFPAGYVKLTDDPTFKVELDDTDGFTITLIKNPDNMLRLVDGELTIIVGNMPGAALPNTGGPGTWLFRILGSILILGAGVLLWRRRRLI